MKKYNVNINGKRFEVEIEEILGNSLSATPQPVASPAPAVGSPAPIPAPAPSQPEATPANTSGGGSVAAPIPGTVLDIKVSVGQAVNAGDVLLILEAMKMENEVCATAAGKISNILVSKGSSVNAGDVLINLE